MSKRKVKKEKPELLVDQNPTKKWSNWWTRSLWTMVMIATFLSILTAGPMYLILLVAIIQVLVYREVILIGIGPPREKSLPWFRSLHWYFFIITNYFLYGDTLIYYYKSVVLVDSFLVVLGSHHRFISFLLYCFGLMQFVLQLKKGHYKFQFSHFCWTHMALLLIIVQSHFIISNIFEGLIWFVLPVSLVVCNDIFAYVAGFFFGKTPLIRLSPKKTWEGFIGGFIVTTIFGFFFSAYLAQHPYMTCSLRQVGISSLGAGLTDAIHCQTKEIFLPKPYQLFPFITGNLSNNKVF